jgi:hypothetical protein
MASEDLKGKENLESIDFNIESLFDNDTLWFETVTFCNKIKYRTIISKTKNNRFVIEFP